LEKIRLIDPDGYSGIISKEEAYNIANERGLNIIELSSNAKPPVWKIIDYGKFKYEQKKRKKQKIIKIKNIKFRPNISKHDRDIKVSKINSFVHNGNKVKIIINYRGREINNINFDLINSILDGITTSYKIESKPKLDGKNITTVIC